MLFQGIPYFIGHRSFVKQCQATFPYGVLLHCLEFFFCKISFPFQDGNARPLVNLTFNLLPVNLS